MSSSDAFMPISTTRSGIGSTAAFFNSSSILAKIAFLLLVIFGFVILLNLGTNFLAWYYSKTKNPHLIDGLVSGKTLTVVPQDPSLPNMIEINRSNDQQQGIEFTWSVWIFIDDLTYNQGKYKCVFYKGNDSIGKNGINSPNNAPGLYIGPNTNELIIKMDTFQTIGEEIKIENIPMNKWVNVIIRCENTEIDVYINGTIAKSHRLAGVPKQNYNPIYVGANGGFSGYLSNLWYYDHALGIMDINQLVFKGPDMTMRNGVSMKWKEPNYLSLRWYLGGVGDAYNPTAN